MSILVLEDNPTRIKLFKQGFIGACTTIITTAPMMISWLQDHTPRLMCLDYDLDQYGTDIKRSGTGLDVASYMNKQKRFARTLIVIHSLNDKFADKMAHILQKNKFMVSRHPKLWESPADMERLARTMRDIDNSP